jgi:hypothetical protein
VFWMNSASKIKVVSSDEQEIQRARKSKDDARPIVDVFVGRDNYDVLRFRDIIELKLPEETIIKKKKLVI